DTALHDSLAALDTPAPAAPAATPSGPTPNCGDPTRSLRPAGAPPEPGAMPAGSFMRTIQRRGRLVAGVDQNTLLFAYLDPFTGRLQGLEIDLLRDIAKAILGKPTVDFKVLTTSDDRLQDPEHGSGDLVADGVTINCSRLEDAAFSSVYYLAQQRVLVPTSSTARSVRELGGKRVCARAGTTSLSNIAKQPSHLIP